MKAPPGSGLGSGAGGAPPPPFRPRAVETPGERKWPTPRRWRAAAQNIGGVKGAPGLAGRGPSARGGPLID